MKILCPACNARVPANQINIAKDLAFCPNCNEGFSISETVDLDEPSSDDPSILNNPPSGTWFHRDMNQVVVGATTRSPAAFFLVPFMCVWSGGSLGGIYGTQIAQGKFVLMQSLFGIPFLLGTIFLGTLALMTVFGKVEVTLGTMGKRSSIFVGIGPLGWRRYFDWNSIRVIKETDTRIQYPGGHQVAIIMEGATRLKFGTGLNEARRYYLLNVLKELKAERR